MVSKNAGQPHPESLIVSSDHGNKHEENVVQVGWALTIWSSRCREEHHKRRSLIISFVTAPSTLGLTVSTVVKSVVEFRRSWALGSFLPKNAELTVSINLCMTKQMLQRNKPTCSLLRTALHSLSLFSTGKLMLLLVVVLKKANGAVMADIRVTGRIDRDAALIEDTVDGEIKGIHNEMKMAESRKKVAYLYVVTGIAEL